MGLAALSEKKHGAHSFNAVCVQKPEAQHHSLVPVLKLYGTYETNHIHARETNHVHARQLQRCFCVFLPGTKVGRVGN